MISNTDISARQDVFKSQISSVLNQLTEIASARTLSQWLKPLEINEKRILAPSRDILPIMI
jgi:hypothetical protein